MPRAQFVPTHRVRAWRAPRRAPEEIEVQVVGDVGRDHAGAVLVRLVDGVWHWRGRDPVTGLKVTRRGGRPRSGKPPRVLEIRVRIDVTRTVGVRVNKAERDAFIAAAAPDGPGKWLRRLLKELPLPDGDQLATHLRLIGCAAAGITLQS